ncbi:MAG: DUF6168 family protein [Flavobacteriaceae bacterium]
MAKKYSPFFLVILCTVLLFFVHKSIVTFSGWNEVFNEFHYALEKLYLVFGLASLLIIFILIKVKQRNFDQIGMTFMALITVKMATFYFVFKSVITDRTDEVQWERTNFIILFMTFLIMETLISAQILKSKPSNNTPKSDA